MKKKIYLLCLAMVFMFASYVEFIGPISINLFPGFIGPILLFVLAGEYLRESMLARVLRPVCVAAAIYSGWFYVAVMIDYSKIAESFTGNVLSLVETCLQLIVCYLLILMLQNVSAYLAKSVPQIGTALLWFAIVAFASAGAYFCGGAMAVISRIIQYVAVIVMTVMLAKGIAQLEQQDKKPRIHMRRK